MLGLGDTHPSPPPVPLPGAETLKLIGQKSFQTLKPTISNSNATDIMGMYMALRGENLVSIPLLFLLFFPSYSFPPLLAPLLPLFHLPLYLPPLSLLSCLPISSAPSFPPLIPLPSPLLFFLLFLCFLPPFSLLLLIFSCVSSSFLLLFLISHFSPSSFSPFPLLSSRHSEI